MTETVMRIDHAGAFLFGYGNEHFAQQPLSDARRAQE